MITSDTMYLKINILDLDWQPGIRMINKIKKNGNEVKDIPKSVKVDLHRKFSKFIAEKMVKLLVSAITTQRYKSRWEPLTPSYIEFKRHNGLSLNIWEATGMIKNHIVSYKYNSSYIIGINPRAKYPGSDLHLLQVAKWMEFGNSRIPARPLFQPIVNYMKRNIRKYWDEFLRGRSVKNDVLV